jgi:hypothetical protein
MNVWVASDQPGLRDLHQQLAEVLALEQAKERGRRILLALDHGLAIPDAAAAHPFAHIAQEIRLPGSEIPDDEAAQSQALAQHREHVGPGHRRGGAVLGDQPAHRDAGEVAPLM